ncbi:hybrid sensor histidine kinase/response regulator, partial [Duganella sp. FT109W]
TAAAVHAPHVAGAANASRTATVASAPGADDAATALRAGGDGAAASGPLPDAGLNSAAALKRLGGLESVYLIALRSFIAEAEKLAAQLQTAREEENCNAALPALHTLKGLAGTVGADRLAALSQQAELALKDDEAAWAPLEQVLDACPGVAGDIEQLLSGSRPR